jgi:hypothetical protein
VNNPKKINNDLADSVPSDEQGQLTADSMIEIDNAELEQVSGGGNGTAIGLS